MPTLRLVAPPRVPSLLARLKFDPALEAKGFQQLAQLDVAGARDTFARLAGQLTFDPERGADRPAVLVLYDVLQRVNRRLHRAGEADSVGLEHRAELIERFAGLSSGEGARSEFLPALDRLLATVRPSGNAHPLVERAQAFIEANYQRRLSLSAIATALHVSPNYLSRVVRKATGATVTARIHAVRLEHARLLLARGERTISEIAYVVGYQNYRDFYRNFVKYERASPRNARRLMSLQGDALSTPAAD